MLDDVMIAPSILSANFLELGSELERISSADLVHFDVMDGSFVPNLSFGIPILKQVKKATELPLDVHLMIEHPDTLLDDFIDAGADYVCFHQEAAPHAHRLISHIHERGCKAAMALNPGTAPCVLESVVSDLDMILVMTVDPGFGGQAFIPSSIEKVREVRALCERHGVAPLIEVDGGIGTANAAAICDAGANVLVAGSSVFRGDYADNIQSIREQARQGISRQA